jgi:general secretion pathway protein L
MAQLVIGLDLGSHSIKVVGLERAMRGFLPVFVDEEVVPVMKDAEGKDLPFAERAAAALGRLKERGHLRGDIIAAGLPGSQATCRSMVLPLTDPKKVAATLPFELEASVPFDLEDIVYDSVTSPRRDGEPGVSVLVGVARRESVAEFLEVLAGAGVDARTLELSPLALDQVRGAFIKEAAPSAEPVVTPGGTIIQQGPDAMPSGVAVVDIGSSQTNVCISMGNAVIAARTILRGGQDLTRALAKEFELPLDEAERGKLKEAYLDMPDAPAPYPEQQRISACLKKALMPLVRELRQTFQGITAEQRVRIRTVHLVGGTARVPNVDRWLSAELNMHVLRLVELDRALAAAHPVDSQGGAESPQFATSMALALSALAGNRAPRIDFRQGDFAHKGNYEFVLARAPQLAAGFMCVALLLAFNAYARHFVISRQEAQVAQKQRDLCKSILNQDIDSADRCLAIMREKINPAAAGTQVIPERSALDAYIQVAQHLPKEVTLKVESLDITPDKLRIKGRTDGFENVDKIVKALESGKCFRHVEKGPARQEGDKVSWTANVDLDCTGAPADAATAGAGGAP